MNFEYPSVLYAVPLLLIAALLYAMRSRSQVDKKKFPLFVASALFLVLAVANPYWRMVPAKEQVKGVDLILITDVSQSMFSIAQQRTKRIDVARKFLKTLLPSFAGSQVALIYFAGDAQIGSPFTSDLPAITLLLESISPGMSAQAGTKTDSVQEAIDDLLRARTSRNLPLVLFFSDGEFFDSGRSLQNFVRGRGLRVLTYLCGTQKAPVLRYDLKAPVPEAFTTPNPVSLQRLAEAGKGTYFDLTKERPNRVVDEVTQKVQDLIVEGQSVPDYRPVPFMLIAVVCLLLYQWLPVSKTDLKPAVTIAVFLVVASSVSMKPDESLKIWNEAIDASSKGKIDLALKTLNRLPPDFFPSEKEIFAGNLYYRQGKVEESVKYYQRVLEREPFHKIARWNWEVALKHRSDSAQNPPQPQQKETPQSKPEERNALLQYVDQLEKEQRQKSNQGNIGKSEFAW